MSFSAVNTYTVTNDPWSGAESSWRACVRNTLCSTWKSKTRPKRASLPAMLAALRLQKRPGSFPGALWGRTGNKTPFLSHSYLQLMTTYYLHTLCVSRAGLRMPVRKRPHLKPNSVDLSYLSRFPRVYCRRKTTQIRLLNSDSFHSFTQSKKVFVSFFFSVDGIKLAA